MRVFVTGIAGFLGSRGILGLRVRFASLGVVPLIGVVAFFRTLGAGLSVLVGLVDRRLGGRRR